jgi:hypothetical protein
MVTGEMLLNGDGQLHEGDWGGIGEDGDYEAGEGDEEGGHNNSGHHNVSIVCIGVCVCTCVCVCVCLCVLCMIGYT